MSARTGTPSSRANTPQTIERSGALPARRTVERNGIGAGFDEGSRGVEGGGDQDAPVGVQALVNPDDGHGHGGANGADILRSIGTDASGSAIHGGLRKAGDGGAVAEGIAFGRLAGDDQLAAEREELSGNRFHE